MVLEPEVMDLGVTAQARDSRSFPASGTTLCNSGKAMQQQQQLLHQHLQQPLHLSLQQPLPGPDPIAKAPAPPSRVASAPRLGLGASMPDRSLSPEGSRLPCRGATQPAVA